MQDESQQTSATHVLFADECRFNCGRFRSIAAISLPSSHLSFANSTLSALLINSQVRELKWERIRSARERYAANKCLNWSVTQAALGELRVDVLVWDTHDSRHRIPGRDDIINLEKMYYHLMRNIMVRRWPSTALWRLHPDENTAIDWSRVETTLFRVSRLVAGREHVPIPGSEWTEIKLKYQELFRIEGIRPVRSISEPLVQLADLYAGLATFSRMREPTYRRWLNALVDMFPRKAPIDTHREMRDMSAGDRERSLIMHLFMVACREQKNWKITFLPNKGLETPSPTTPINFWFYRPQSEADLAPIKKQKRKT